MPDVGRHIADYRKQNSLTQEQLASALHVTRQTVSSWENGRTLPDVESLAAVASALDVSVEELIYGKRTVPPTEPPGFSRHRRLAVIMGACAILAVLLEGLWPDVGAHMPPGIDAAAECLLRPLIWVFCTVQLLALVAMSRQLKSAGGGVRAAMIAFGTVTLAAYGVLCLAHAGAVHSDALARIWQGIHHSAWLFALPAAALFFGLELSLKSK